MLRRLHKDQPESFAFTPANTEWAEGQIAKYPEGRQASAVIPLLWRAQEQEGWVSRPAIEEVARLLDMAPIRVLEVATFYFMFQLQPVGKVAHIQVCGTTSCMICGAEDLTAVCREKIAPKAFQVSDDGKLSWEEVECLGACANAPMAQIGKDYYEDLTAERLGELIDAFRAGDVPAPGPQNGRFASEPLGGPTTLKGDFDHDVNASKALAARYGDTLTRIDGGSGLGQLGAGPATRPKAPAPSESADKYDRFVDEPVAKVMAELPDVGGGQQPVEPNGEIDEARVEKVLDTHEVESARKTGSSAEPDAPAQRLDAPKGEPDDLTRIKGIGPKINGQLNDLGIYHFWQIADWGPEEAAWINSQLVFKGRVEREGWIAQAKSLSEAKT